MRNKHPDAIHPDQKKCPECGSYDVEYVFDWIDRRWFVCHHCGYEVWEH